MYERRWEPLLPRRAFLARMARHLGLAGALVGGSLLVGIVGYAVLDGLPLVDAFLNAAMLLGGMGPVATLTNDAAKVFAGLYALYAGIVFIAVAGILAAPVVHRILHRLSKDEPATGKDG
jgi:hypothetical protein